MKEWHVTVTQPFKIENVLVKAETEAEVLPKLLEMLKVESLGRTHEIDFHYVEWKLCKEQHGMKNSNGTDEPSAGAVRAAMVIRARTQIRARAQRDTSLAVKTHLRLKSLARIIDRETGLPELISLLEALVSLIERRNKDIPGSVCPPEVELAARDCLEKFK